MLLLAPSVCGLFKWRQFKPEVILLAVAWVQRYGPELQRRLRRRLKPTSDCWRVDKLV